MITYASTGKLVAKTPLHVGSGAGNEVADSAIARDHDDRGVLWGTGLAGIIRELALREVGLDECDPGFQYLFGNGSAKLAVERESRLWVFDAPVCEDTPDESFAQDRTSIDPATGTVVQGRLFTEEHSMPGIRYDFRLELDVDDPDLPSAIAGKDLLRRVLEHLEDGAVRNGGKASIGRGRVRLSDHKVGKLDWSTAWKEKSARGVLLEDWKSELASGAEPSLLGEKPLRVVFEAQVTFPTPIMIQQPLAVEPITEHPPAAPEAAGLPKLPDHVVSAISEKTTGQLELASEDKFYDGANYRYDLAEPKTTYLPGSSTRGAMRGRLLNQVRSAYPAKPHLAWDVTTEGNPSEGHPPKADSVEDEAICRETPEKSVCLVRHLFGYAALGGTIFVDDVTFEDQPPVKGLMHVAVDRITRAPGEGKLFSHLVLWPSSDTTATLRIELLDPSTYDIGVVALLLKDIYRGHIRIGHGKSIGQGRLGLSGCTITAYVPAGASEPPATDQATHVGSFERRPMTIKAPDDPLESPSWVPKDHAWFEYLNECAKSVKGEMRKWAAAPQPEANAEGDSNAS